VNQPAYDFLLIVDREERARNELRSRFGSRAHLVQEMAGELPLLYWLEAGRTKPVAHTEGDELPSGWWLAAVDLDDEPRRQLKLLIAYRDVRVGERLRQLCG
jgi:hypothetical protein